VRFGDVGVNQRTYHEEFRQTYWRVQVPTTNAENLYNVGNFQMPFDGKARVDLFGKFEWIRNQFVGLSMAAQSTPSPTESSDLIVMDTPPDGFICVRDIASHAIWNSLTAGQVVTMIYRVYVGGGEFAPVLISTAAVIRMFRH
jgi:hypothetical protein